MWRASKFNPPYIKSMYTDEGYKIYFLTHPSPLPGGEYIRWYNDLIPLLGGVRGG